jgi:hypothetical protein
MNTPSTMVELEAVGIRFYSQFDESAFFEWLNKLSFVTKYEGRRHILYITINSAAIDEDGLRETLALFRRYGVGLRQLSIFDREEFADWFRNKNGYWFKEIFGLITD